MKERAPRNPHIGEDAPRERAMYPLSGARRPRVGRAAMPSGTVTARRARHPPTFGKPKCGIFNRPPHLEGHLEAAIEATQKPQAAAIKTAMQRWHPLAGAAQDLCQGPWALVSPRRRVACLALLPR